MNDPLHIAPPRLVAFRSRQECRVKIGAVTCVWVRVKYFLGSSTILGFDYVRLLVPWVCSRLNVDSRPVARWTLSNLQFGLDSCFLDLAYNSTYLCA